MHADAQLADRATGPSNSMPQPVCRPTSSDSISSPSVRLPQAILRRAPEPPGEFGLELIGSGRVGDVRLRGTTEFDVSPNARFRERRAVGLLVGEPRTPIGKATWSTTSRASRRAGPDVAHPPAQQRGDRAYR